MDDDLIKQEIINQLTLGQWELAKSLILVFWKNSFDEENTREWISQVLINVCSNPEKYCVGSLSVQSIYHLSWLTLQLIEELKIEKPEIVYLKKSTEFKLYVYKASEICDEVPYQDLSSIFVSQHLSTTQDSEEKLISTNIENFLYDLKNKDPFLASYILKSLLDKTRFKSYFEDLTFNWMQNKCEEIKTNLINLEADEKSIVLGEQILSELRVYVFIGTESEIDPHLPENIVYDLLLFSDHNIFSKKNVYEALLGNTKYAAAFCKIEDQLLGRDEHEKDTKSAENFFHLIFLSDGSINTKELFLRSMRRKEHFLKMILNNLLIFIKSKKYIEIQNYLNHRLTSCLRPLLVLLSWDEVHTNQEARELLDCLWPDSLDKRNFEPIYVKACEKLVRNVNFAEWCLDQREKNYDVATNEETNFSRLCHSLKSHSVVYVLKQYLQLSKLNINAVEDILQTFMSPKNVTKEKSVRFAESENDDWEDKVQKSVDCKILLSYCIMSAAMEAVQFASEFENWDRKTVRKNRLTESVTPEDEKWTLIFREKVINNLKEVEQLLPSLYPLILRLEILENLFTLIFATHDDTRTDANTDSAQSSEYEDDHRDFANTDEDDSDHKAKYATRSLSDGTSVLSNCSGNSSNNYRRRGFLCNNTVIHHLLKAILVNLSDITQKFTKRNTVPNLVFWNDDDSKNEIREKKFLHRVAELKNHSSQAEWRLAIITGHNKDKTINDPIMPCPVYLKIEAMNASEQAKSNNLSKTTESHPLEIFGSGKSRKRNRVPLNSTQFHGCANTKCCHHTVNKILCTKESLLNMCVEQADGIKVQQVLNMCTLTESDSATEIIFSQKYKNFAKQFEMIKTPAALLIPANPIASTSLVASLRNIASTAAAGISATTDVSTVYDFLSSCTLPNTSKIEEYMKNSSNPFHQELAECLDLKALVFCDLAFTSSQSLDSSASLLSAAIERFNSNDVNFQFLTRQKGLYNFAYKMVDLISNVSCKQNSDKCFEILPVQTNLCNLLIHGSVPLDADDYCLETDSWSSLLENLTTYYEIKERYLMQSSNSQKVDSQLMIDFHSSFENLVRDESNYLQQRLPGGSECVNYLKTIHMYMYELATLKGHQNPEYRDTASRCNFLSVMNQELMSTLINMIKDKDANLETIEKFTNKFGLDFKHLITQACIGPVSALGYKPTEYGEVVANSYGQIILNCKFDEGKYDQPCNVVNLLLVNLIYFIKENYKIDDGIVTFDELRQHRGKMQQLLNDIDKLSSVDLTSLKTNEECCSFLVNAANLLALHAAIIRNKENVEFGRSRLLNESCQVAYHIGQFGVISLLELHCLLDYSFDIKIPNVVLETRKRDLMNNFNIADYNAKFLISRSFLTSSKLIVSSADTLNDDITCAIRELLDAHVVFENKKEISLPDHLIELLNTNNGNQTMQTLIKTHCTLDQMKNYKSDFKITPRLTNYFPAILFSFPSSGFESFPIAPPQEKAVIEINQIPNHVRDYLKEKCWLVDYLISVLSKEINDDERMVYMKRLLDEFKETSSTEILVPSIHEINFWIDLESKLINRDDWEKVLNFIDVSSTVRLEMKKSITPIRDFILCHLLNNSSDKYLISSIKNSQLQAYAVLSTYRNWDYNTSCDCILNVASNHDLQSELKAKLETLYRRMTVYGQILKTLSTSDSWQSIEDRSLNNPEELLDLLMENQYYSLAVEWTRVHTLPEELDKNVQHVSLMLYLENDEPDFNQATLILEKVIDRYVAVDICDKALNSLRSLPSQVFVIEYMVNNLASQLSRIKKEELYLRHMGIKIMYCLPQSDLKYFEELLPNPELVVEQLILNTKIELLGKALQAIKEDILALNPDRPASGESIKSLLRTYAKKSLEVQIIQAKLSPSPTYEQAAESLRRNSESFIIPLYPPKKDDWEPDELHSHCMVCREEAFNMFNRRHHCRRCGRVVCATCSQHRKFVLGYEDVKVRVCDKCNEIDTGLSFSSSLITASSLDKRNKQNTNQDGSPTSSVDSCSIQYPKLIEEPYQWLLMLNEDHNKTVREEFNFEQTPNVSLCISLLDCFLKEQEAATYVLDLCEILFLVLKPDKDTGLPNPEINHNVIVGVMETLIMSAKMKFVSLSHHAGMGRCDSFTHSLNLVKLLITSNCHHLVPSQGINNQEDIRKLRNKLVGEERWKLALEVSTKNRLDIPGVWANWGLALLKSCEYSAAREKFDKCLEKNPEKKLSSSANDDILSEIIKELEINLYKFDNEMLTVRNCLGSLKSISNQGGQAFLCPKRSGVNMNKKVLAECIFYLQNYGLPSLLISFFIKHKKIDMALTTIHAKQYDTKLFVKYLFMPCLQAKLTSQLEMELLNIDHTLLCWQRYIRGACKKLEQLKFYNSLHRLQLFCKDFIRAAQTCVKLFSENAFDYDILFERLYYLDKACDHLKAAQQEKKNKPKPLPQQPNWEGSVASLQADWPIESIEKFIKEIEFQIYITKYLKECKVDTSKLIREIRETQRKSLIPVVFEDGVNKDKTDKQDLSAMLFLASKNIQTGYKIASSCIEKCHLKDQPTFAFIGKILVQNRRYEHLHEVITLMKNSNISSKLIDATIFSCITILIQDQYEYSTADKLIEQFKSDQQKTNAYRICGRLRHSYISAIKSSDVQGIYDLVKKAEKTGDAYVLNLCKSWLTKQNLNTTSSSNNKSETLN